MRIVPCKDSASALERDTTLTTTLFSQTPDDMDQWCDEDTLVQLKTCANLTEEDEALVAPQVSNFASDECDIDDGEFWANAEESDVDYDLGGLDGGQCSEHGTVASEDSSDMPHEEREFNQANSIITFLSIVVAMWSQKFNGALNALLKLLWLFVSIISSSISASVFSIFPRSAYKLKNFLHIEENNFIKYVVCPTCHSLYNFEDCFEVVGHQKTPRRCSFVAFPEHPHQSRRLPCGDRLLSEITLKNGKKKYHPRKCYCYKSIIESLTLLIKRKGFLKSCEAWRLRKVPHNNLCDIYDGQIWKDFQYINSASFLAVPHNLALMVNIDWFSPYKHSPYSVGAIYLVVTNLPRSERFKKENVILVGLIPGPGEPPIHMNSYLDPLVEELWTNGIQESSPDFTDPVIVKAALICSACDIPACCLGFVDIIMSKRGCSKCTKEFSYNTALYKIDFGGFSACPLRTEEDHRQQAFLAMNEKTSSSRDKIEKKFVTSLMHLPYFDCVRFHVVDPMHKLFLGTSKYMMKNIWLSEQNPLIDKSCFSTLQERVDKCIVPSSMGRIPHKIASSFSSFTTDQWKTWTNVFSLFALHGIIGMLAYICAGLPCLDSTHDFD